MALAVAPVMPGATPRVLEQLGYDYPWGPDGTGGPPLLDELEWAARSADSGTLAPPTPLFPRLEIEAVEVPASAPDNEADAPPAPADAANDAADAAKTSPAPADAADAAPATPAPGSSAAPTGPR